MPTTRILCAPGAALGITTDVRNVPSLLVCTVPSSTGRAASSTSLTEVLAWNPEPTRTRRWPAMASPGADTRGWVGGFVVVVVVPGRATRRAAGGRASVVVVSLSTSAGGVGLLVLVVVGGAVEEVVAGAVVETTGTVVVVP